MTDEQLKWNIKTSMNEIKGSDEEKSRAAALFDTAQTVQKTTGNYHRIPGIAAAAIALVFILALGRVGVFAMTGSFSFRDFFFKNSEQQFEDVYTEAHKELILDEYKIVYEGSIYDESVDQGSLNFSIRNTQDQPIEFSDNITLQPASIDFNEFYHNTLAFRINFGSEEGYLFLTNINSAQTFLSGDSLFVTFSRLDLENPHYRQFENMDVQFLLLGKEEYSSLNNEIAGLDEDKLFSFDWDPVEQKQNITVDYILAQSELTEILSKYNPHSIESIEFPSQIIQIENLKLTIGRTNMVMEYNENGRTIENFAMIREDGTRINFRLDEQYVDSSGNATKIRLNWIVDGVNENRVFAGAGNLNGDLKLSCNYGFILGNDEKVKIEADGRIYE